jgi:dephospho-CoA kinase
MLRVGLTGGLGSGKSTVAGFFRKLGALVIESDAVGRALMQPGQNVYSEIVAHFGAGVVAADGSLDRSALAAIAFGEGRIEELNAIVHPAVIAAQAEWMRELEIADPHAIAMVESALIFETKHSAAAGWHTRFDKIILVTAPEAAKVARYLERIAGLRGTSVDALTAGERAALEADARRRLAAQISDSEKAARCDYIIENVGTMAETEEQVKNVFDELRRLA